MSSSAGRVLQIFKGDYSGSVQYDPMDCVLYQGSTYVCKATTQGNAPTDTTYWQLQARGVSNAAGLSYSNSTSGLTATNVQAAIDEEATKMNKTSAAKTGSGTTVTNTIAANTSLDDAVGTLLNNDAALNTALTNKAGKSEVLRYVSKSFTWSGTAAANTLLSVGLLSNLVPAGKTFLFAVCSGAGGSDSATTGGFTVVNGTELVFVPQVAATNGTVEYIIVYI